VRYDQAGAAVVIGVAAGSLGNVGQIARDLASFVPAGSG
jgi:hypothetical protein